MTGIRVPKKKRGIQVPRRWVGHNHPDTSQEMQRKALPKTAAQRRLVYDFILAQGGATDDEIELGLEMAHQSASPCRRGLVKDGWVVNSGVKRKTRYNNLAIVWKAVEE